MLDFRDVMGMNISELSNFQVFKNFQNFQVFKTQQKHLHDPTTAHTSDKLGSNPG